MVLPFVSDGALRRRDMQGFEAANLGTPAAPSSAVRGLDVLSKVPATFYAQFAAWTSGADPSRYFSGATALQDAINAAIALGAGVEATVEVAPGFALAGAAIVIPAGYHGQGLYIKCRRLRATQGNPNSGCQIASLSWAPNTASNYLGIEGILISGALSVTVGAAVNNVALSLRNCTVVGATTIDNTPGTGVMIFETVDTNLAGAATLTKVQAQPTSTEWSSTLALATSILISRGGNIYLDTVTVDATSQISQAFGPAPSDGYSGVTVAGGATADLRGSHVKGPLAGPGTINRTQDAFTTAALAAGDNTITFAVPYSGAAYFVTLTPKNAAAATAGTYVDPTIGGPSFVLHGVTAGAIFDVEVYKP